MENNNSKNDDIINKNVRKASKKKSIPHSGTKVFQKQPLNNTVIEKPKLNKSIQKDLEGFSASVDELINPKKITPKKKIVKKAPPSRGINSKENSVKSSVSQKNNEKVKKSSSKNTTTKRREINNSGSVKRVAAKKASKSKKATPADITSKINKKSFVKTDEFKNPIKKVNKKTEQVINTDLKNNSKIQYSKNINNKNDYNKFIKIAVILIAIIFLLIVIISRQTIFSTNENIKQSIVDGATIPIVSSSISPTEISLNNTVIPPLSSNVETSNYELIIKSGMSAKEVAHLISLSNYVDEEGMLNYFNNNNLASKINIGTYIILPSMSYEDIADTICLSDNFSITIYPGLSIDQIDSILVKRNLIKKGEFINACTKVSTKYGVDFVEGWFLSGKYEINRVLDVNQLALNMFKNTLETLSPFLGDISNTNFSIEDILIIASLIQAETKDKDQMPLISEVIHNRLKANMPLGINATTCYEIGNYTTDIDQEVYDKITPFNTRRQKGLVPTPICSVSFDSINAAVYPLIGDYLYYNHDKEGNIHMAKTYEEHLANIEGNYKNGI